MKAKTGTITRRMDEAFDGLSEKFRHLYTKDDFKRITAQLNRAKSNRGSVLKNLYDMLDACGIAYEQGKDNQYYTSLAESADLLTLEEAENEMIYALYSEYDKYPSPEQYMLRIVNRLSDKRDGWDNDTLRLRILKQFIKYGNYLEDAGYKGKSTILKYTGISKKADKEEVLSKLDDDIFDYCENLINVYKKNKEAEMLQKIKDNNNDEKKIREQMRDSIKKERKKYALINLSDDLAEGRFRTGGATKKGLYLFAMVFGMTYYPGEKYKGRMVMNYDFNSDIEKNLFHDYYINNLIRFISPDFAGHLREYEIDPTGAGINYKNFAEMIYIYFISKDYEPVKKIELASKMIKNVVAKHKSGDYKYEKKPITDEDDSETAHFRKNVWDEDVLIKDEKNFEEFILKHYNCKSVPSEIQIETEQNTAFRNYNELIEALQYLGTDIKSCSYGLWFKETETIQNEELNNICSRHTDIDTSKFKGFIQLLKGMNDFVTKQKILNISEAKNVTRTSMLVAYYYYYNAKYEGSKNKKMQTFKEMFNHFQREINTLLEESGYQLLSGRNLFDVLIAFSSYVYLYN